MSDLRLAVRQLVYENRSFWRNPPAAFFTFAFPLIFLVLFNLLFGDDPIEVSGRRVGASVFYIPAIAALSIVSACFTNIAMGLTFARDQGLLKRVRGTPLPAWAYLAGRVGQATGVAVLLVVLVTAAGVLFYDVDAPTSTLPGLALTVVVGAAAFCALGLAMTAAVPNADAATAIVNAVVLPLLFISDVFIRLDDAPRWLVTLGEIFPVKHLSEALQTAFNPFETGAGLEPVHLGIMAAWGVVGMLLAARFFSWEPRR